jgi:ABC-type transport system involved in cytochrome bd biosynthesis fused ATPase/permease subunit
VNLNRKTVAWAITVTVALMTINVTYTGITTGVGLIPGMSFLLWTFIALAYTTQEEVGEYIRENRHRVTEPAKEQALNLIKWTKEAASPESQRRLKASLQTTHRSLMNRFDSLTDQIKETIDHVIEKHL